MSKSKCKYKIYYYLPGGNTHGALHNTYYTNHLEWKDGVRLKFINFDSGKVVRLVGHIVVEEQ